jgi:hypothetical protein
VGLSAGKVFFDPVGFVVACAREPIVPDCDDTAATCTTDCSDADNDGTPDC